MASPFPGMDPYLEDPAFWADFKHTFICRLSEAIGDALPEDYDASIHDSVYLVPMSQDVIKLIQPNVVASRELTQPKRSGTLLLEPVSIPHEFLEEVRQTRIEILHRPERTLVAVLEMLSPFNKSGEGFEQYRAKRKLIVLQKVHLVELDLLVGGKRLPLSKPLPSADYYALISRAEARSLPLAAPR